MSGGGGAAGGAWGLGHAPLLLEPNRVRRAYRGGALLDRFGGAPDPVDGFLPEDWVGLVTPASGPGDPDGPAGLSGVGEGRGGTTTLRELVRRGGC